MLKPRNRPATEAVNNLYNIDFGDIAAMFDTVAVGDQLPDAFLPILGGVSGDKWSSESNSEFTLWGSRVLYMGPPTNTHPSCSWFKQIVVVKLDPACTALQGNLVFHLHRT